MDIKVLDKDFNLLATLDGYASFQGERSLWEIGSCELHIGLTRQGVNKLIPGNLLTLSPKRTWIITRILPSEDRALGIVVSGKELKNILKQRLVVPDIKDSTHHFGYDRYPAPQDPDAAVETIMKHYVNKHAVNPSDSKRKLPRLVIGIDRSRGLTTRWSERFKPVTDTLKDIGEYSGIGYTVYLDYENKQFVFDVIPERNQIQGSDNPIVFSSEFNNVSNVEYEYDVTDDVTVAYAGGTGEDENRLIQQVARTAEELNLTGYNRKETWIDATNAQTADELVYEARHQLSQHEKKETLTCSALPNKSFEYLINWDIGSIVTIESKRLGISQNQKITAVKEIYERGKIEVIPTFGKRNSNIIDEIRKSEVIR